MANYYFNEAAVDLPERTFVDKTIHALEYELPGGQTLAVFVHRRPIEGGKTLRKLVDENVALNHTRLSAYTVLDAAQATVGGIPAIVLRTSWRRDGAKFYQVQAHVAVEGNLMIFAVTTPLAEKAAGDEAFDGIVQSVAWRTR